jgi:hypothetical protein
VPHKRKSTGLDQTLESTNVTGLIEPSGDSATDRAGGKGWFGRVINRSRNVISIS